MLHPARFCRSSVFSLYYKAGLINQTPVQIGGFDKLTVVFLSLSVNGSKRNILFKSLRGVLSRFKPILRNRLGIEKEAVEI